MNELRTYFCNFKLNCKLALTCIFELYCVCSHHGRIHDPFTGLFSTHSLNFGVSISWSELAQLIISIVIVIIIIPTDILIILLSSLLSLAHSFYIWCSFGTRLHKYSSVPPWKLHRSYFCLGHFYMLEELCKSHLKGIYTSLYHWNSNSAKCTGEYSDLICGVNMSLLIQINSADQITLFPQRPSTVPLRKPIPVSQSNQLPYNIFS